MAQSPAQITRDQLQNREIVTSDLLSGAAADAGARRTAITVPSAPVSVFGRKLAGHDG